MTYNDIRGMAWIARGILFLWPLLWAAVPAHATEMRGIDTETLDASVEEPAGETDEDRVINGYLQSCLDGAKPDKRCEALRQEAVPMIKEDVLTLGASADPAHLPVIADILLSDEAELRTAAADAIGMIGPTPAETPALTTTLNDRAPEVRRSAHLALEHSRDPAAKPIVDRVMIALARPGSVDDTETFQTVVEHFKQRQDDSKYLKEEYHYIVDPAYLKELEKRASDNGETALTREERVFSSMINAKIVDAEQPSRNELELARRWFAFFGGAKDRKVVERSEKRGDFLALDEREPRALQAAILYYELAENPRKIENTKGKANSLGDAYAKKDDLKKAIAYYEVAENNAKIDELSSLQEARQKKALKEMEKDETQQKQFKKEQDELEKELGF
jgi:HEAT repeats